MDIGGATKDACGGGSACDSRLVPGIFGRSILSGSVCAMFWIRVFNADLRKFY